MVFLEQKELAEALNSQSTVNPERIELSKAIHIMEETPAIQIAFPSIRQTESTHIPRSDLTQE